MNDRIDFRGIAQAALADVHGVLAEWLPGGRMHGAEYVATNPTRGDERPGSFSINTHTGAWSDFASGDKGGDLVALVAYLERCDQADAARVLGPRYGIEVPPKRGDGEAARPRRERPAVPKPQAGRAGPLICKAVPVPADAPVPPEVHARWGQASASWTYRDAVGQTLLYVRRFDPAGGERKQILPLSWGTYPDRHGVMHTGWHWKSLPAPRPLYGLDRLAARPEAPVLVCEGEKTADAAGRLLPDWVCVTSMGGAKAPDKSDWSALAGRQVVIWPDADEPGASYAQQVRALATKYGFAWPGLVSVDALARWRGGALPEGWDAADALAEGMDAATAAELAEVARSVAISEAASRSPAGSGGGGARKRAQKPPRPGPGDEEVPERWGAEVERDPSTGMPWPDLDAGSEFQLDAGGVYAFSSERWHPICLRPVWVHALTEGLPGEDGIVIRYFDRRWRLRQHAIPGEMFYAQSGLFAQLLANQGLFVVPGKEKWVARYLTNQAAACTKFILSTSRLGWYSVPGGGQVFVLPRYIIGDSELEIVYQSDIPASYADTLRGQGELQEWVERVAGPARGNPLIMFAVMAALAGPLMKLCNEACGGFHFHGTTSRGKTTLSQAATSVWGSGADPAEDSMASSIRTWDTTANAIEGISELHSNQVLVLDEIGRSEIPNLGGAIYKLGSGVGKERATMSGGLRPPRRWRTMIISNGERSLAQIVKAKSGQDPAGGVLVRIVSVPIDGEGGESVVVVDAHGEDPKDYVEALKRAASECYGTAGPTMAAYLVAEMRARGASVVGGHLREELAKIEAWLVGQLAVDPGGELPAEGRRVLRRFALVALAGARAGQTRGMAGILPWPVSECAAAVLDVARRWLRSVGDRRSEIDRAIAYLRDAIVSQAARFCSPAVQPARPDVLGLLLPDYWCLTDAALDELCGSYDPRTVTAWLREQGLLWVDGKHLKRKAPRSKLFGDMRPRLWWVQRTLLGERADGISTEDEEAGTVDLGAEV